MGHEERITFGEIDSPLFYCRYVDDIYLIGQDKAQLEVKAKCRPNINLSGSYYVTLLQKM